jgi:hypothetical protein
MGRSFRKKEQLRAISAGVTGKSFCRKSNRVSREDGAISVGVMGIQNWGYYSIHYSSNHTRTMSWSRAEQLALELWAGVFAERATAFLGEDGAIIAGVTGIQNRGYYFVHYSSNHTRTMSWGRAERPVPVHNTTCTPRHSSVAAARVRSARL